MAKVHPTETVAIVVTPGSQVTDVITEKDGSLKNVYVFDGSPAVDMLEAVADAARFAEIEERFNAAMDDIGETADCDCGDDD